MTTYSSKPIELHIPVNEAYSRISDMSSFQQRIDTLPDDVRAKIGSVKFSDDSITISTAPMGDMILEVTERIPDRRVALQAKNAPVKLILSINLTPKSDSSTEVVTAMEVDIPMMLKPMVGPKLQEAADKFGEMVQNLAQS